MLTNFKRVHDEHAIQLFAQKKAEIVPSDPETHLTTAMTNVLASSVQLGHSLKELSKHFDAFDDAIDAIDGTETRNQLKQLTNLSRETLSKATLRLSQEIRKLPRVQIEATWKG